MEKQKAELNLIHDNDLLEFLKNIELLNPIHEGKVKCKFCKEVITITDINAVFPEEKSIKVCCTKPECIIKFTEYLNDKKYEI